MLQETKPTTSEVLKPTELLDSIFAPEVQAKITSASQKSSEQEFKALGLDHQTRQNLHGLINRAIFWGGHILLMGAMAILICRVAHFILPDGWHWLNDARLKEIDHLILGLMTGLATRFWPNGKKGGE